MRAFARVPDSQLDAIRARIPLAALIGGTVTLKRAGKAWIGQCPFHDDNSPSFAVYANRFHCFGCGARGDAIDWLMYRQSCSFQEAANALAAESGLNAPFPMLGRTVMPPDLPAPPKQSSHLDEAGAIRRAALAREIWCSAVSPVGSLVDTYLASRGLRLPEGEVIRFHPACPRGKERLPAMVALMVNPMTNEPRGVHRTFLRPDGSGKADGVAKLMLGRAGVIKLHDHDERLAGLGIAEGIETALSVAQHVLQIDVWACGSAGGIESLPVYPAVCTLHIFSDRDPHERGLQAARACAGRWSRAGKDVRIIQPKASSDWNDVSREIAA